jgi:hypothetical protein
MLSHAIEEIVHHARFSGNAHINLIGNVLVIIVAAARDEGEQCNAHHKDVSPDFHCFHFCYVLYVNVSAYIIVIR